MEQQAKLDLLHELMALMSKSDGSRLPQKPGDSSMLSQKPGDVCPDCGKQPCVCDNSEEQMEPSDNPMEETGEPAGGAMKVVATGDAAQQLKDKIDEMMKAKNRKG